jgi:hypothetical protein
VDLRRVAALLALLGIAGCDCSASHDRSDAGAPDPDPVDAFVPPDSAEPDRPPPSDAGMQPEVDAAPIVDPPDAAVDPPVPPPSCVEDSATLVWTMEAAAAGACREIDVPAEEMVTCVFPPTPPDRHGESYTLPERWRRARIVNLTDAPSEVSIVPFAAACGPRSEACWGYLKGDPCSCGGGGGSIGNQPVGDGLLGMYFTLPAHDEAQFILAGATAHFRLRACPPLP